MPQKAARPTGPHLLSLFMAVSGLLLLTACGGSSSPTTTTPTTTQPTPPPPRVVLEGSLSLDVNFVNGEFFTTDRAGTLDATVDYTFASSQIVVWIARGQCSFQQFLDDQCTYAATSFAGSKPRRVSVTGASAGTYTFIVFNAGPDAEAISFQVVLTPSAGAASAVATEPAAIQPRGSFVGRMPRP